MRFVCMVQIRGNKVMQRKTGGEVSYTLWLSCPRVLGELFMKVLTEEEQVQQGAFLWGATTADSQVGLGLSCGLWILMMVQWSRYANLQCSFSPVSAERRGCVQICNLCCGSAPSIFFPFFCTLRPITFTLSFVSCSLQLSPPYLPHFFHLISIHPAFSVSISELPSSILYAYYRLSSHSSVSCTLLTLSLMIDSALKIM